VGTRAIRWLLITAPVVAGIVVLLVGTAGAISTTFGMVLIGIGPIAWMWNWLVRMSFDDEQSQEHAAASAAQDPNPHTSLIASRRLTILEES
jgi:uncharacterized membrane protein